MRAERGVVLVNALVVVLAIAAVATAMLIRSEGARMRVGHAQSASQLELYLDGSERLVPRLLRQVLRDTITHPGQVWADGQSAQIDRGRVSVTVSDLQGRLNVNWLTKPDDVYAQTVFAQVFADLGLPQSLLAETGAFLRKNGPARTIEDLWAVPGMTPRDFDLLRGVLSALPSDTRVNINTAPAVVLRALIAPLPPELRQEILDKDSPHSSIGPLRQRASALLETEEIDHLHFGRMTIGSQWFRARLVAELADDTRQRAAVFRIEPNEDNPVRRVLRWAVYD